MTTTEISEIIFEEIESHLSPQMTFKKETDDQVIFTFGYGVIFPNDISRIFSACRTYGLQFAISARENCIDVKIDKYN